MRTLATYSFILFMLFAGQNSSAQSVKAIARIDSSEIIIGQQTKLVLSIQYRADNGKHTTILWPEISDTLRKEVEVVGQSKMDTVIDKADPFLITQSKTLQITSFDSGYWAIPPFKFYLNGDTNAIQTDPLLLQVSNIPVDTTLAIKDIKPPYEQEYTWIDWIKDHMSVVYWSLAGLALIIIGFFVGRYLKKLEPPLVIEEKPKIPAHIIAFEKLEKLKEEKLWQEGKLKAYYSSLTDILREYLENRFKIQALEQTTDEILFGMRNVAVDEESSAKLKRVLVLADLVKFAKENPLPNENELCMNNTYDFINGTKREEEMVIENKAPVFVDKKKKD